MKLLRMRLANWLTKGGYLAACKAATHWEDRYQEMSEKAVKLEQTIITADNQTRAACQRANTTEQHLRSAERALIEKDERINNLVIDNNRMSEAHDAIIRAGEGKIGPSGNGSLRRVVRMAEAARHQGEMSL